MKCYEEKVMYKVARNTLSMGDCFLWHGDIYIVSNRGDINLSNGCSESICSEADVEKVCAKVVYTFSANGKPETYIED